MKYTIEQLAAANSLKEISGKTKTGSSKQIQYKEVDLVESEPYSSALIVQYFSDAPVIIADPGKVTRFLHRGC